MGREEIASVLVVVEKTPAHCVSVIRSTLGRQPRARGDTHIWNRCGQPDIGGTAFLIHPVRTVATV